MLATCCHGSIYRFLLQASLLVNFWVPFWLLIAKTIATQEFCAYIAQASFPGFPVQDKAQRFPVCPPGISKPWENALQSLLSRTLTILFD